ncbi:MFS transporter [Flammeovirga kamogawensis]|uniref:MFS transporter n=1 Tax=Flammeovirga kamogawensis TaxID=373891 RepID=A0ABX8H1S8_9BACT|nr:MFS transporter [Flammeovirga kamogawensis]MBB6463628.1 putative MFS family arabinose efflux permease [Flammeovirga kamogawensis]QWG09850.1 MFS transporter [Flammeovirga kamogawensis]TRX65357.1 MFS transporter [Flammeovirga kamogawensis]
MNTKILLMVMTLIAVVSDTMLHPFFPQFFGERFNMWQPEHVGYYLAASCLVIMISFPFWARVQKKVNLFTLLIFTQCIAGFLCLGMYWVQELSMFWLCAMSMLFFKGSYLLIYPYIMRLSTEEEHSTSISILSVIVHLGAIVGAFIGGGIVDYLNTGYIFIIMALGDAFQFLMCIYIKFIRKHSVKKEKIEQTITPFFRIKTPILKIGLITMLLYFSTFFIRPFFSIYWEAISAYNHKLASGFVYSIPALVGLFALWFTHKYKSKKTYRVQIINAFILGILGISLQGVGVDSIVFIGRIIYGWAVFQLYVQFDVVAFKFSTPDEYATDYSRIHLLQNFGVLSSSIIAGYTVDKISLTAPFWCSAVGFCITLFIFYRSFTTETSQEQKTTLHTST